MKTHTELFASALTDAYAWLDEICDELGWMERHEALQALRAALHVLRDHLSVAQNTHLSAQLPTLVRGIYYEGWRPSQGAHAQRSLELYLAEIERQLGPRTELDAYEVARTVYAVLERHVSPGEIQKLQATLPHQLRVLWEPV